MAWRPERGRGGQTRIARWRLVLGRELRRATRGEGGEGRTVHPARSQEEGQGSRCVGRKRMHQSRDQ